MKILHFIYGLSLGGAESFIRSCILALANENIEWHFALQNPLITNQFFVQNVPSENIHILPPFTRKPIGQYQALKAILRKGNYDIVHIHANALINPIPLICCLKLGQKFVIHSHSTSTSHGLICRTVHHINKAWLNRSSVVGRIACSKEAGRWMFGCSAFTIINNAIDVNHFIFNEQSRAQIREKYGISDDAYVVGTVGRMVEAKNYPFIITLFQELKKTVSSAKLLLVGDGPLMDIIKSRASDLMDSVIFAGAQQNTAPFYSAMDCFIAPSLFEGLSIVTVEAQASGVNIIVSDAIPAEVNVSGYLNSVSLSAPLERWLDCIGLPNASPEKRLERGMLLRNCEFDIPYLAMTLRNIYME